MTLDSGCYNFFTSLFEWLSGETVIYTVLTSTIKIKNLRDAKLLKMKAYIYIYILINFHSQAGQNMVNKTELSNLETNFVMLHLE